MIRYAPEIARPLTMAARAALRKLHRTRTRMTFRPAIWRGWEIRDGHGVQFWYPTYAGDELKARGLVNDDGRITQDGIDEMEGNIE